MKKTFEVVDMFCGAGGESTGIMLAAREREMNVRLTAINHWERAIETHAANHPSAEHLCQSVEHIDPAKAVPGQRLDLLWASPECTHHSVARGGRPRSGQSRASAWLVLKWLSELYVSRVIIENVPEFLSWGPLDDKGRPIPGRKGKTFRAFIAALRSLGYSADWRILNAADYGDPTTRRRLFYSGRPWPEAHHSVATAGAISLIEPFITRYNGGDERNHGIENPLPTLDTSNRYGLVEPLLVEYYGQGKASPASLPVKTITTKDRFALLEPFLIDNHTAGTPERIDESLRTVTTKGWFGLISPERLDIRFRMLRPHELVRAQGFPDDYRILGTMAEQTKQIGNAVPVNTAKVLTKAVMEL